MATSKLNFVIAIFTFAFLIQAAHSNFSSESDDDANQRNSSPDVIDDTISQQGNNSGSSILMDENFEALHDILYANEGKSIQNNPRNSSYMDWDYNNSNYYYPRTGKQVATDVGEEEVNVSTSDDESVYEGPITQKYRAELPNDWEASTSANFRAVNTQNQKSSQLNSVKELNEAINNTSRLFRRNECFAALYNDGYANPNGEMNWNLYENRINDNISDITRKYIDLLINAIINKQPLPSPSQFCEVYSWQQSSSGIQIKK